MTLFVTGFLDFVLEACTQVAEYLRDKQASIGHYLDILDRQPLSPEARKALFVLVQVSVCDSESLNITAISRESGISIYQVKNHLSEIEPLCVVAVKSRSKLYRADLDALERRAE